MTHHRFIDVHARDHQGPEEIAFTRFIHPQTRADEVRINLRLIPQPGFFEDLRLQHKLHKVACALALHQQLAAGVKIYV